MAEVLASSSVKASALAFGGLSDVSFLAAGTAPGSPNPGLLVYRTAAAYVDGVLPLAARFPSPAAFCRVACSRPTEASCYSSLPAGLIAAGLKSGVVAVWDPREALLEPPDSPSGSSIFDDYFCQKDVLPQEHDTTPNLVAGGHDHENRATVVSDPQSRLSTRPLFPATPSPPPKFPSPARRREVGCEAWRRELAGVDLWQWWLVEAGANRSRLAGHRPLVEDDVRSWRPTARP